MRITYTGGPRGFAMLRAELDKAGVSYTYDSPIERRDTTGAVAVAVVVLVANGFLQAAGEDAWEFTKKVAKQWHDKPLLGNVELDE